MTMIDVDDLVKKQEKEIADWHKGINHIEKDEPFSSIQENNHWNYQLWHEEDIARKPDIIPERMVLAKRNIDHYNQQRNNAMEKIDEWVADHLKTRHNPTDDRLHSETPGMMIDRLSIMTLKKYHMCEEVLRESASKSHQDKCKNMVSLLELQINDLSRCLREVLTQLENGELRFRVYRQMKMYNDPNLNPQLYTSDPIDVLKNIKTKK